MAGMQPTLVQFRAPPGSFRRAGPWALLGLAQHPPPPHPPDSSICIDVEAARVVFVRSVSTGVWEFRRFTVDDAEAGQSSEACFREE